METTARIAHLVERAFRRSGYIPTRLEYAMLKRQMSYNHVVIDKIAMRRPGWALRTYNGPYLRWRLVYYRRLQHERTG